MVVTDLCSGCWGVLSPSHLQYWGVNPPAVGSAGVTAGFLSCNWPPLKSATLPFVIPALGGSPHPMTSQSRGKRLALLPQRRTVKGHPSSTAPREVGWVRSSALSYFFHSPLSVDPKDTSPMNRLQICPKGCFWGTQREIISLIYKERLQINRKI